MLCLGLFSVPGLSSAADVNLGSLGDENVFISGSWTGATTFTDNFDFTVDQLSSFGGIAATIKATTTNLTSFNSALLADTDGNGSYETSLASNVGILQSGGGWVTSLVFAPLYPPDGDTFAPKYELRVTGQTTADGIYGGVVSIQAIPEPEIYAMMVAGLGLMGFVGRRRRKQGEVV